MAKVKHKTITFGSSAYAITRTTPVLVATHTGPTGGNDTLARTISSFYMSVSIDPSGNPPPIEWWHTARLNYCVQWNPTGSGVASSNENDSLTMSRWVLYPTPYYDLATNALYGVTFQPRADVVETATRRKGNGTNTPKVLFVAHLHDSYGVLTNPGSGYSVNTSFVTYTKAVWESDT